MPRRLGVLMSAIALIGLILLPASPASALSYKVLNCSNLGTGGALYYTASSYGSGGYSSENTSWCSGGVAVRLHYYAYPGSPSYTTSYAYGTASATISQSGTYKGEHNANACACYPKVFT